MKYSPWLPSPSSRHPLTQHANKLTDKELGQEKQLYLESQQTKNGGLMSYRDSC